MKNKKLILINLLTLAAFILVVGAGIYRAEATKDDFGKPKETEKIDLEVSKKEKETMEINEGAELITPATFMKKSTIGSVAFRHADLFSVVDTTTEDGEEVVNEEIIVEAEEEDSEAVGYTNRSTQEKHTVHPKKENIPQTTIVNKSEKEQVRSKETIKQDANKEKEVKEPVKEKPVDDNEKESTTSTKPTASPEKTESSQPENPELQPDKENSGEDEKPEDTQNSQDEQDEPDEEQSPTSDEERIKEF